MSRARRTSATRLATQEMSIRGESAHVVERAARGEARIVTLGPLLFFSTQTGDAWMLDPADHLALRLAKDGVPLPAGIVETVDTYAIEWNASYALDGAIFKVIEGPSRETRVIGYPVEEIQRAIRRMKRQ